MRLGCTHSKQKSLSILFLLVFHAAAVEVASAALCASAAHYITLQPAATKKTSLLVGELALVCPRFRASLLFTATHYNALYHTATHCTTLHYTATRGNSRQHKNEPACRRASAFVSALSDIKTNPAPMMPCCSVLQRVAVCCSVLQCVTVCCSESRCVNTNNALLFPANTAKWVSSRTSAFVRAHLLLISTLICFGLNVTH